jgi:hypothetical protein
MELHLAIETLANMGSTWTQYGCSANSTHSSMTVFLLSEPGEAEFSHVEFESRAYELEFSKLEVEREARGLVKALAHLTSNPIDGDPRNRYLGARFDSKSDSYISHSLQKC